MMEPQTQPSSDKIPPCRDGNSLMTNRASDPRISPATTSKNRLRLHILPWALFTSVMSTLTIAFTNSVRSEPAIHIVEANIKPPAEAFANRTAGGGVETRFHQGQGYRGSAMSNGTQPFPHQENQPLNTDPRY